MTGGSGARCRDTGWRALPRLLCLVLTLPGLVLGLGLRSAPAGAAPPAPGAVAPDFRLPAADQHPVALSGLRGKLVLLHFWASWCPVCQQMFPWLNDLQARYGAQGLQVLGIAVDSRRADADDFLLAHPAEFQVVFDPAVRVPRSYDVQQMPTLVLIDRQGKVLQVQAGFPAAQRGAFEQAVRAALPLH